MTDDKPEGAGGVPRYDTTSLFALKPSTSRTCGWDRVVLAEAHDAAVEKLEADLARVTEERDHARNSNVQYINLLPAVESERDALKEENARLREHVPAIEAAERLLIDINVEEIEHMIHCPEDDTCECPNVQRLGRVLRGLHDARKTLAQEKTGAGGS